MGGRGELQEYPDDSLPMLKILMLKLEIRLKHEPRIEDIQLGLQLSHQ